MVREERFIMNGNAQTERLVSDVKRIVRDSEELLHDSKGALGNGVEELRERLTNALDAAKSSYRKLEEKSKAGVKATDKAIRTHPYQALGIALGAGILAGFVAGRRCRSRPQPRLLGGSAAQHPRRFNVRPYQRPRDDRRRR